MATKEEKEAKANAVEAARQAVSRERQRATQTTKATGQRRLRSAGDLARYLIGGFSDDPLAAAAAAGAGGVATSGGGVAYKSGVVKGAKLPPVVKPPTANPTTSALPKGTTLAPPTMPVLPTGGSNPVYATTLAGAALRKAEENLAIANRTFALARTGELQGGYGNPVYQGGKAAANRAQAEKQRQAARKAFALARTGEAYDAAHRAQAAKGQTNASSRDFRRKTAAKAAAKPIRQAARKPVASRGRGRGV